MIDTLYVNGCSWTEGHLLQEQEEVRNYAASLGYDFHTQYEIKKDGVFVEYPFINFYNKFNWAGNIAQSLNIPNIVNHAVGAASNDRIVRTTIDYVRTMTEEQKRTTLIIIGWTISDRSELYLDDKLGIEDWVRFHASHRFKDTLTLPHFNSEFINKVDKFHQNYVVDIHTDYACIHNFFQQSYLLANLLENNNIPYYFFNSFPIDWKEWSTDAPIYKFKKELKDYSRINTLDIFDNFFRYVDGRPEYHLSDGHPNLQAYKVWSSHILEDMKRKGIV
jgi:hypothetical protein